MSKINVTEKELTFLFMVKENRAICPALFVPRETDNHINMNVVRSCENKRLVLDENGYFILTEAGEEAIEGKERPLPPIHRFNVKQTLEQIILHADDKEIVVSFATQFIKTYIDKDFKPK